VKYVHCVCFLQGSAFNNEVCLVMFYACRRYAVLYTERDTARVCWCARNPGRGGRRALNYPAELFGLPPFSEWFRSEVESEELGDNDVHDDVKALLQLPRNTATKYRSMYGYGYHCRIKSAKQHMKTADSGVVATFRRPFQNGQRDRNIVIASLEYVGNVEEILELDYGIVCLVVLVCTWVKANYRGPSSIIKKDRWGFTVANFESLIQPGYESFAFPLHVDQVYLSRCPDMPGWKVVI
jgi:hypothetical protein